MHQTQLRKIDLNLLTILAALLEEQSVTGAANKVGLSQSAMSRALGRLRDLFGDQLLVRTAKTNSLTPRAEALKPQIQQVIRDISGLLAPEVFNPEVASVNYRLAINDYAGAVILPRLTRYIHDKGYDVNLNIQPNNQETIRRLELGELDMAIGAFTNIPGSYYQQVLFEDRLVCLVRSDHPVLETRMTLNNYLAQSHLVVSLEMEGSRPVDRVLHEMGKERNVKMNIPYFSAAPSLLTNSDMMLTLPEMLAKDLKKKDLAIIKLPIKFPAFLVSQIWHPRLNMSPAHMWLRKTIMQSTPEKAD